MPVPEQPIDVGEYVLHGTQPTEVLPAKPPSSRPRFAALLRNVAVIAAVLAVVVAGGGATVAYRTLSGGGPQPEKYAPASTFAFAKVDLDPAAGEKVAAYRFAQKFPSSFTKQLKSGDDLRDRLLQLAFKDSSDPRIDYDNDIKPWLGARVGVAGFLDRAKRPQVLGIVAVKDAAKARQSLQRLAAQNSSFAYVVKSDYALMAQNMTALNDAVAQDAQATLAHDNNFRADMQRLGGGQLVTGWADLGKISTLTEHLLGTLLNGGLGVGSGGGVITSPTPSGPTALSPQCLQELQRITAGPPTTDPLSQLSGRCRHELLVPPPALGSGVSPTAYRTQRALAPKKTTLTGRVMLGVHLHSSSAELVVHLVGTKLSTKPSSVRDMVTALPSDTVAALAVTGVSSAKKSYDDPMNAAAKTAVTQGLGIAGVELNVDDLLAALGDSLVVSVGNVPDSQTDPQVAVRTHSPQPAAAQRVVTQLNAAFAKAGSSTRLVAREVRGDLIVTNSSAYADKLQTTGTLGDQKEFKDAVGSLTGTVEGLGYVDLHRILDAQPDHGGAAHALTAAGFVLLQTADEVMFRLRVLAG
jgi:hypothetical protein